MTDSPARRIVVPALLASLLAASAWISIPMGSVPFTLQIFVVVLCALLLTPRQAAATLGVYLGLGALGAPVFSGGVGGLGVLLGPTGGYLLGFLVGAVVGAMIREHLIRRGTQELSADLLAGFATLVIVYLIGWLQLSRVTGMSGIEAFVAGVVPFALLDVFKTATAAAVAVALRRSGVVQQTALRRAAGREVL